MCRTRFILLVCIGWSQIAVGQPVHLILECVFDSTPAAVRLSEVSGAADASGKWQFSAKGKTSAPLAVADFLATLHANLNRSFKSGVCKQDDAKYELKDTGYFTVAVSCAPALPADQTSTGPMPDVERILRALVIAARSKGIELDRFAPNGTTIRTAWRSLDGKVVEGVERIVTAAPITWTRLKWQTSSDEHSLLKPGLQPTLLELEGQIQREPSVAH